MRQSIKSMQIAVFAVLIFSWASLSLGGGISSLAGSSQVKGVQSSAQAAAAGVMFQKQAKAAPVWAKPIFYTLATVSYTGAAADLASAFGAGGTSNAVNAGTTPGCDPTSISCPSTSQPTTNQPTTNTTGDNGGLTPQNTSNPNLNNVKSALAGLNSQGYSYNPSTGMVNTPQGSFPVSAFASGQTMADSGIIPQSQVGAVDKMMKNALSKFTVSAMAVKGGGGGGGGNNTQVQFYNPNAGLFGKRRVTASAQTAGLTRQLANGEVIGSATDNIFAMIHRQYLKQTKLGEFIQK